MDQGFDVGGSGLLAGLAVLNRATQTECAVRLRNELQLPVAAGGYGKADQAEDALQQGRCDLVALGRPLLSDPYWAAHAAMELSADNLWPAQYPLGT